MFKDYVMSGDLVTGGTLVRLILAADDDDDGHYYHMNRCYYKYGYTVSAVSKLMGLS